MKICEIFYSIQGESTFLGLPCIFIRTSGCNLKCLYCDTRFAYEEGYEIKAQEILEKIKNYNCNLIEITGGEPLLQEEVYGFIEKALKMKYLILFETNGSLPVNRLPEEVIKILDIKCPGSGQSEMMDFNNLSHLNRNDQVKFVIMDENDYNWAKKIIEENNLTSITENILFSPVYGILDPKKLAEWILKDNLNVRLQVQMHKIIWGHNAKGV